MITEMTPTTMSAMLPAESLPVLIRAEAAEVDVLR
jgi:hypothetical protein